MKARMWAARTAPTASRCGERFTRTYARQLSHSGHAYPCFCTPERLEQVRQQQQKLKQNRPYDGTCRRLDPAEAAARVARGEPHVIRFKTPREGAVTAHDLLRGDITVENRILDDYVLVKSDGLALYHLAAMVDDHLMGITHVIRGSEWLPTFPLHAHIHPRLWLAGAGLCPPLALPQAQSAKAR